MASRETPPELLERLLRSGDPVGALRAADALLAKVPTSFVARLARCRAELMMSRFVEAERDLEIALRLSPRDDLANLLRADLDMRAGHDEASITRLRPIAMGRGPHAAEAMFSLLDALYASGRRTEMVEAMKTPGAWTKDDRAQLYAARAAATADPESGIARLTEVFRSRIAPSLRRFAGFEAVGLLDKAGRYREAWDLATETHRTTGVPFDMDNHLIPVRDQLARVEKGVNWITPKAPKVDGVAIMVALPRSGTTLLEQMLDRHPAISGIGEYDGLGSVLEGLDATGAWPRMPQMIPADRYAAIQALYMEGANRLRRPGAPWVFDKVLRTWRCLPEVAAVLPGAVCIQVDRDPRDLATSLYLSYFHERSVGWTGDLGAAYKVIELKAKLIPRAFDVLGIPHETVIYEDLVEDPGAHAERCLARMGLAMDERVLAPEDNTRLTVTVSTQQVRKPINRSSIGRWRNYEWAFDAAWEKLSSEHHARRRSH